MTWPSAPLAKASKVFGDGDWIESKDQSVDGIRLVQTGNVGEGYFKDRRDKARFISGVTFDRLNCTEVLPGDVLISRLPDPVGRSCIIPDTGDRMITAVDCTIVRPDLGKLEPSFLVYYTQTDAYQRDVEDRCTGTTRKRISRKHLGAISFPLPPLEEQKRIVAVLDQAFAALHRARALAEANLADISALLEQGSNSIISGQHRNEQAGNLSGELADFSKEQRTRANDKKFRGPLVTSQDSLPELPRGWIWASPEQLCTNIVDCLHSTPKWRDKGQLCLKTTNFRPNHLDLDHKYYVSEETYQTRIARLEPKPGDVLYSREGGILGIACVLPDGIEACLGQRMMQFRLRSEIVDSDYFCSVLNSGLVLKEVRNCVKGAAAPHLNIGDIRRFPIPVPPIDIQRALVSDVGALSAYAHRLCGSYEQRLADSDDFRQSLLQKAFAGKLT